MIEDSDKELAIMHEAKLYEKAENYEKSEEKI
jgi:hypothetical protein